MEATIAQALNSVVNESKPNLRALARKFDVPYVRLRRRHLGKSSRIGRPQGIPSHNHGKPKKLTELRERELLDRISQPGHDIIKRIANQILARDQNSEHPPPTVDNQWCSRFTKRHSQKFTRLISNGLEGASY